MDLYIEIGSGGQAVGFPVLKQNLAYIFPNEEINPENMLKHGYHIILDNPPTINDVQRLDNLGFSKKPDGTISFDYVVVDLNDEERLNRLIRQPRAQMLAWSDWTQIPDAPLTEEKRTAWAKYRQDLRDLTTVFADATSYDDIIWPKNPNDPENTETTN